MDFQMVADCLAVIESTGSTLQKEAQLRKYGQEVDGFKEVLKFIYDPYFTTGLKQAKLDNAAIATAGPHLCSTPEEIMSYLRRNNTGTLRDAEIANGFIYAEADENWQWAATGLVTKDLQIGVSVTTLNKVYGKAFIPKIGIMRGMLCPDDISGYYLVTEKIDGNRRLIMNKDTGVEIYTRSGKRDTGLYEIERDAALLPKGYVFDCECVASGEYADSIELRQASASILNRRNQQRGGVVALCFDVLKQEEYDNSKSKMNALGRKTMAAAMLNDQSSFPALMQFGNLLDSDAATHGKTTHMANSVNALWGAFPGVSLEHIKALPILGIARNKQEGIELAKPIWDVGGEGVMLVDWNSAYEVNPNPRKTLLKIKMLKEFECRCIGIFEGSGKYQGMMGGIYVEYVDDDKKVWEVGVGTGFTDYMRSYYYTHRDQIVGRVVELDSFGVSTNAQGGKSLNCPVFKRIKGEAE